MKCYDCSTEATHYVQVIYSGDDRWTFDSEYSNDYACQRHIGEYISTFNADGVTIIEIGVERLGVL